MNKTIFLFFIISLPFNCYCQQDQISSSNHEELIIVPFENGKIEDGKYKCNLFDWEIEIPYDFTITSQERIKQLEDKGYAAMQENAAEGKNIKRETNNLIGFEKDRYNTFSVTYEALEGTKKISLEEHKQFIVKLLEETYSGKGIKFDIAQSNLKLRNYDFYKVTVHIYHPKTDQLLLTQEFYTAYINNHLFTTNINSRDENSGNILNYNFMKSFQ